MGERITQWSQKVIYIGFALLFILIPLVLTPWNYELFEYNKMLMTYALTAIITAAWLGTMISGKCIRIRKTPLDIPIAIFFLSQLIATLFSMDPHVSWLGYYSRFNGGMFSVISYVLLYYAFVSTIGKKQMLRYLVIILVTALVVSLYGILEHFGIDKNLWVQDVQSRVFSTLGQPNWLGAYLVALIPLGMGFALKSQIQKDTNSPKDSHSNVSLVWNLKFVIWNLITIIFFLTLLWTRSRSGLLAFALTDVLFWFLLFREQVTPLWQDWKRKLTKKRMASFIQRSWMAQACIALHAAFLLIIIVNGTYFDAFDRWFTIPGWQKQFSQAASQSTSSAAVTQATESASSAVETQPAGPVLETGGTESSVIRKYVWEGAVNAWKSSPKTFFIGTGTETFAFAFYQFKPAGHNLTSEWDFLYNKAHNEYLNFLATTGIIGLGAYLFLIGSIIWWFIKMHNGQCRMQNNYALCIIHSALFCGWISILITNFFGFSVVAIQIFFFLFPAFLFLMTDTDDRNTYLWPLPFGSAGKNISLVVVSIGMVSTLLLLGFTWYGDVLFSTGYHLSRMGYGPQAYSKLKQAIIVNPSEPFYHDEMGTTLAELALAAWTNEESSLAGELGKQGLKENETALAISPNNVNFWKTRTKILYTLSPMNETFLDDAITALQKAETLSPMDPKILYNLAILYGRAGLLDKGIDALMKAKDLKTNYRDAYYGLAVFYKEKGQPQDAAAVLNEYLTTVDPTDKEFKELIGQ